MICSVLIVEDDLINVRLFKEILKNLNIAHIIKNDGISALELIKKNPDIRLVLMDIGLPNMSGAEVLQEIKKIKKDITVIAQTAYGTENEAVEYKMMGFDDFISKPIDIQKLKNILSKYIT